MLGIRYLIFIFRCICDLNYLYYVITVALCCKWSELYFCVLLSSRTPANAVVDGKFYWYFITNTVSLFVRNTFPAF